MNSTQVNLLVTLIGQAANITTDGVNYILPSGQTFSASDVNDALTALATLLSNTQNTLQEGTNAASLTAFLQVIQSL